MRLRAINIENFKGVRSSYIPMSAKMAFIGKNGAGKSSTLKGVIYGVSGALPENPIRNGAKIMNVDVLMDSGDTFSRRYCSTKDGNKTEISLNGKKVTATKLDEYLSVEAGLPAKQIKVVTSTDVLSALKADEFGSFILQYLNEPLDFDKVIGYCPV